MIMKTILRIPND